MTMLKGGRKKKKSARVVGRGRDYWVTAAEFWRWQRQGVIVKVGDRPLTGKWVNAEAGHLVTTDRVAAAGRCRSHTGERLDSKKLVGTRVRRG